VRCATGATEALITRSIQAHHQAVSDQAAGDVALHHGQVSNALSLSARCTRDEESCGGYDNRRPNQITIQIHGQNIESIEPMMPRLGPMFLPSYDMTASATRDDCTMLDGDHTVYFDRVEANWPFRIQLPVGSQLPLHCTASGKLFLAYMEPRQRQRLLGAAPLKRYTDRTITDIGQLSDELKRIENDGIGVDDEEFMAGMTAVAVPVFTPANSICFTVAVHAPAVRKPLAALRQYVPALRQAAAAMAATYCDAEDA